MPIAEDARTQELRCEYTAASPSIRGTGLPPRGHPFGTLALASSLLPPPLKASGELQEKVPRVYTHIRKTIFGVREAGSGLHGDDSRRLVCVSTFSKSFPTYICIVTLQGNNVRDHSIGDQYLARWPPSSGFYQIYLIAESDEARLRTVVASRRVVARLQRTFRAPVLSNFLVVTQLFLIFFILYQKMQVGYKQLYVRYTCNKNEDFSKNVWISFDVAQLIKDTMFPTNKISEKSGIMRQDLPNIFRLIAQRKVILDKKR